VNGKYILKSGTDFRQFSVVTLTFNEEKEKDKEGEGADGEGKEGAGGDKKPFRRVSAEIECVEVTREKFPATDADLEKDLEKFTCEF